MTLEIGRSQSTFGLHRRELIIEVVKWGERLITMRTFSYLLGSFAYHVAHVATSESVGPLHGIGSLPTDDFGFMF